MKNKKNPYAPSRVVQDARERHENKWVFSDLALLLAVVGVLLVVGRAIYEIFFI
jgi:hypothetical protein